MVGDTPITDYYTETPDNISARLTNLSNKVATLTNAEKGEIKDAVADILARVEKNPANNLEVSNGELDTLKTQIQESQKDLQIAEDRAATLRHPEKNRSYYESWFPINRPLTNSSIVIILAIGIFFFVMSFFILFKSFGFNLRFSVPWDNPETVATVRSFIPPIISNNVNKIIIGILILFIVLYATKTY
jgi:hypothetical protein